MPILLSIPKAAGHSEACLKGYKLGYFEHPK